MTRNTLARETLFPFSDCLEDLRSKPFLGGIRHLMFQYSRGWYLPSLATAHETIIGRYESTKPRPPLDAATPCGCLLCKEIMIRPGASTADAGQAYEALETGFITKTIDNLFKRAGLSIEAGPSDALLTDVNPAQPHVASTKKDGPMPKRRGDKKISVLSTPAFAARTGGGGGGGVSTPGTLQGASFFYPDCVGAPVYSCQCDTTVLVRSL